MLKNEAHWVRIVFVGHNLSCMWNRSNFICNLFISLVQISSSIFDSLFNFCLWFSELFILILNLKKLFQFIDIWNCCENNLGFIFDGFKWSVIDLTWLMLSKHICHAIKHVFGLFLHVRFEVWDWIFDLGKLGNSKGSTHFTLFSISESLIELNFIFINHLLVFSSQLFRCLLLSQYLFISFNIIGISNWW